MKKTVVAFASFLILIAACKKETKTDPQSSTQTTADATAPVITLKGKANDTTFLGSVYTDPGATATDNVDGDISSNIVVSGSVSTGTVGNYTKEYNVKDAAGNAAIKQTRNIRVQNQSAYLEGVFTAQCSYTQAITTTPAPTPTINTNTYDVSFTASGVTNNTGSLSKFPIAGDVITYGAISVPTMANGVTQMFSSGGPISATISIGASKNSYTIDALLNDQMYPARVTTCRIVNTRK